MPMCRNCGARMAEDAAVCPCCGARTQTTAEDFFRTVKNLNDTPDTTGSFSPQDVEANKVMAVLAYLSWLVVIPIFGAKDSPYARFHANQGLVLFLAELIWGVFAGITASFLWFLGLILNLAHLAFVVLMILGIVNAARGRAKELPVIGRFRILK